MSQIISIHIIPRDNNKTRPFTTRIYWVVRGPGTLAVMLKATRGRTSCVATRDGLVIDYFMKTNIFNVY